MRNVLIDGLRKNGPDSFGYKQKVTFLIGNMVRNASHLEHLDVRKVRHFKSEILLPLVAFWGKIKGAQQQSLHNLVLYTC